MPVGKPIPVKVDTRFLAGTNRNLADMVRQGTFRRDLYHRLNIVRVVLPPLRERTEDVPALLDHFSRRFAEHYRRELIDVSQAVRALLIGYSWPGNVRELAAWTERLYVTGLSPEALVEMLLGEVELGSPPAGSVQPAASGAAGDRARPGTLELQPAQGRPHVAGPSRDAGAKAEEAPLDLTPG